MWTSARTGLPVLALALATVLGLTFSSLALANGSRVLAQWSNGKWYPAQVTSYDGRRYHIRFEDGDTSYVKEGQVRPFSWTEGTRVQCKWQQGDRYYQGHISGIRGGKVAIQYDDGDREVTRLRYCRSETAAAGRHVPAHVRESSREVPSDPRAFLRAIERNRARQNSGYVVQPAPQRYKPAPSYGGGASDDPEDFLRAINRNLSQ